MTSLRADFFRYYCCWRTQHGGLSLCVRVGAKITENDGQCKKSTGKATKMDEMD